MKPQEYASKIFKKLNHVCIAVMFMGTVMFLSSCENNIEQIKAFGLTEALPILEASNFETLITDSGVVRYFLKAPKLLRFEEERESYFEFPEGIELIRYNEDGEIISSITANYAKQFEEEKKWEVKNNVIATNTQGDTLKTEQLFYNEIAGEIYTDEFVRIIRAEQNITGIGFESDQAMQNWRIRQPKGSIDVSVNNQTSEQPAEEENPVNSDETE